jgi:pseudouridine-5'-phosphate glycosidase/pseudouridine kinase
MTSVDNSSEWPSSPDSVLLPAQQGKKAYHLLRHYPAEQLDSSGVTSVTGAGDSLAGALLALLARNPRMHQTRSGMDEMVSKAQKAAVFTLQSQEAVSRQLSPALLH